MVIPLREETISVIAIVKNLSAKYTIYIITEEVREYIDFFIK